MVINLALRFILEICALVSLGYWGFHLDMGYIFKILIGISSPLLMAIIWGTFVSPKAPIPVRGIKRVLLEIIIFGFATLALCSAGHPFLAMFFAVLVVFNMLFLRIWEQ
ncbi:YrdB family protein [Heyndrickxia oleronia]|uniref:YrdB family protein n=1 Tax=Heyndrickxia oleronia TaxID=38875 RepID=UPI00203C82B6|nr:YrdB family protein [Heyndrickxia oleronia]MCM3236553.1 YrdB family protein [Heyndrickxia oleronia]